MSAGRENALSVMPSRRRFLRTFATPGLGALAIGAFGGLGPAGNALAACEPPGNPTNPNAVRGDCRLIRPRRPASTLSSAEVQKLRDAYAAMRALDTSDPSDPRGMRQQANVHCWYCGEGTQIHFSWQFFAWHRAYLYFHERILGALVGDPDLRLPYWDWETTTHRKIPPAYATPGDTTNPLWNGTRFMSATDEIPDEDVGEPVMEAALTAADFSEFGGTETAPGIPEFAPHGSVHVDVGGNMGAFATAARDPVFYAHHANLDKMWSDWIKASALHTNPTAPAFLNLRWNFYDENKRWRSISAAQVLNHEAQLRYTYGPSRFMEVLPCILNWIVVRTDWRTSRTLRLLPAARAQMVQALDKGGRVRLHIRGLQPPANRSAVYRVYTTVSAAEADPGPKSEAYLGSFPFVQNDPDGSHVHKRPLRIVLNVPQQTVQALAGATSAVRPALVERSLKPSGRVIPLQAEDVFFSRAVAER